MASTILRVFGLPAMPCDPAAFSPSGHQGPDAGFTRRLGDCGFAVEAVNTRANGKRGGARHVIWLAVK